MRASSLASLCFWCVSASTAGAMPLGFAFSGSVTQSGDPYGFTISAGGLVTGHLIYDVDSVGIHDTTGVCGSDCFRYPQNIPGGFAATIDGVEVVVSEYEVLVSNNAFSFLDVFVVGAKASEPGEFSVAGIDRNDGLFTFQWLDFTGTALNASTLPLSLNPAAFAPVDNIFNDQIAGDGVMFGIDSLTPFTPELSSSSVPVPEPMSLSLLGLCFVVWKRNRHVRSPRTTRPNV